MKFVVTCSSGTRSSGWTFRLLVQPGVHREDQWSSRRHDALLHRGLWKQSLGETHHGRESTLLREAVDHRPNDLVISISGGFCFFKLPRSTILGDALIRMWSVKNNVGQKRLGLALRCDAAPSDTGVIKFVVTRSGAGCHGQSCVHRRLSRQQNTPDDLLISNFGWV